MTDKQEVNTTAPVVKFLVIRFSSIGDIVLVTPVLRHLKQQVENAEVHFLTKKQYAQVVAGNPYIDHLHVLDNNLSEVVSPLKNELFDYVIDLHNNLRTYRVKNKLGVLDFSFEKLNWEKWLYVHFKIDKLPKVHIVDRNLKTIDLFDTTDDGKGLDFFIKDGHDIDSIDLPESCKNGYVAFVIGATYYTKRLPNEKVISICKQIDKPIILLGGPEDADNGAQITEALPGRTVWNTCGKYSLHQSAALVKNANVVISNDTGLMHIAAAFEKKIISVWGNTSPKFGMYPYRPNPDSTMLEVEGLKCKPCSKLGFHKCPKKHFKCMQNIDEQKLVAHLNKIF